MAYYRLAIPAIFATYCLGMTPEPYLDDVNQVPNMQTRKSRAYDTVEESLESSGMSTPEHKRRKGDELEPSESPIGVDSLNLSPSRLPSVIETPIAPFVVRHRERNAPPRPIRRPLLDLGSPDGNPQVEIPGTIGALIRDRLVAEKPQDPADRIRYLVALVNELGGTRSGTRDVVDFDQLFSSWMLPEESSSVLSHAGEPTVRLYISGGIAPEYLENATEIEIDLGSVFEHHNRPEIWNIIIRNLRDYLKSV
jgi:hypothetical protein